ncbi:MAG: AAA family ATPase [Lentisphaerota bacterium]
MSNANAILNSSHQTILVPIEQLFFDPNNYRLIDDPLYEIVLEDNFANAKVQARTLSIIRGNKNQNIADLISSLRANDYLPVDQIQVKKKSDEQYLVIEGNRRIAALKTIYDDYHQQHISLGHLRESIFDAVPVVLYDDVDPTHYYKLMALKHIAGNKKWNEWNRAKLLFDMRNVQNMSEDEICQSLGIVTQTLRAALRAVSLISQYLESDFKEQFTESKYALFLEITKTWSLKEWLDWDDYSFHANNKQNMDFLFSLISKVADPNADSDDELHPPMLDPALVRRDDIRRLGGIIKDHEAILRLSETRSIDKAYLTSSAALKEQQNEAIIQVEDKTNILRNLSIDLENVVRIRRIVNSFRNILTKIALKPRTFEHTKESFVINTDSHLSSITIGEYKNFHDFKIDNLSQINIFAGINNSGKTSLLEAIYLLVHQSDSEAILDITRLRGKYNDIDFTPEHYKDLLPVQTKIQGCYNGANATLEIKLIEEEELVSSQTEYIGTLQIASSFSEKKTASTTRLLTGFRSEIAAFEIIAITSSVFHTPFFADKQENYVPFYDKCKEMGSLKDVIAFIRDEISSSIEDIFWHNSNGRFYVRDSKFENTMAMDLASYGEGMQRIFLSAMLFSSVRNGILLIDELENAIHASLLNKFAIFIYKLAKQFNVQLFITSHSKECIDAFAKNFPQNQMDDFSFSGLAKKNNNIVAYPLRGLDFKELLDAADIDLRRAK